MRAFYSKDEENQYGVVGIKVKINTDDLFKSIEKYVPFNEQEEVDKRIMLKYLKESNNILTRNNEMAHFTSSAFVFNKNHTKVLMTYHKIYNSWGWVGGHSDGDNDLLYVAMKEAMEETGITKVKPIYDDIFTLEIINVNGHEKRGKYVASHAHLNVTYLLEADENEEIHIKEDENSGVAWVPIDEVIGKSTEPWVRERIYKKILDKFKSENKD
ncbi:MAG: NUDIX hydrolase [Clostridia bacterium]|nr:NUDIX hydrolase [Clostridia bacterium]